MVQRIKILRTIMDYTVGRNQKRIPNIPNSRASRPKATTRAEDNFIRVTSLRDRMKTAPNN